jgi:hypothetical protein
LVVIPLPGDGNQGEYALKYSKGVNTLDPTGWLMVATYLADLRQTVSSPRLDEYRPTGGSDLDMIVNYFWNIALSEALYPGLAALEVSLRNSIHHAFSAHFRSDQWFYRPGLLEPRQLRDFAAARLTLYDKHGNQPSSGRIVAELSFSFWITLLSRNYHQNLWNPNRAALLHAVFPTLAGPGFRRDHIHRHYNNLRFLRNRVAHHEPIWNRPTLLSDHQNIHTAIGWINPNLLVTVQSLDRFAAVYANGRADIEARLKTQLGIP